MSCQQELQIRDTASNMRLLSYNCNLYNCDLIVFGLEDSTHNVVECLAMLSSFQLSDAQGIFFVRALCTKCSRTFTV